MGLFDIWNTWTDWLSDWWDAFKDKVDDIKAELWSWVDDIAKYWVKQADMFFDILKHTWSDVENLMEQAKSYADDIVTDAILKIDNWITTFGESVAELWDKLEPYFSNIITPIENMINEIQNIKIPSLEDVINTVRTEVEKLWNKIWEIPDDVWKAITQGWEGFSDFLLSQGERFVEKILDIDLPVDDIIEELERKFKGGGR